MTDSHDNSSAPKRAKLAPKPGHLNDGNDRDLTQQQSTVQESIETNVEQRDDTISLFGGLL